MHKEDSKVAEQAELEQKEVHEVLVFVQKYGKTVGIVLGVIVIAVVAGGLRRSMARNQAVRAAAMLRQARSLNDLQAVISTYPKAPSAPVAMLQAANEMFHSGQYDQALMHYAEFEKKYPEHEFAAAMKLYKAYCFESSLQFEEALSAYRSFVESGKERYLRPIATFGIARCHEQMGKLNDAKVVYEDFIAANPNSDWLPQAETALRYVNRKIRAIKNEAAAPVSKG